MTSFLVAVEEPTIRWDWVSDHLDELWQRTVEHLELTAIAVGAGLLISIVLAALSLRFRWLFGPVTWVAGLLYTIPSLALFAFLIPVTGLGTAPAAIALTSYTLFILIRNIVAGIDAVPAEVRDAAEGMGYTKLRQLLRVELPLAVPAIIAGLRIASVTVVGLVTIAAYVGSGGYGVLIKDGLNRNFPTPIILGAVCSVALAIGVDVLFVTVGRVLTPWRRAEGDRS